MLCGTRQTVNSCLAIIAIVMFEPRIIFIMQKEGRYFWRGVCQLCRNHRSRYRRRCHVCYLWVAPGCEPERCLAFDGVDPPHHSFCRACYRWPQAPKLRLLGKNLPEALQVFLAQEKW